MSPRVRLTAWIAAITGVLAWPLCETAVPWVQSIFLSTLYVLLASTPSNAIRLRPWVSKALIIAGVLSFQVIALKRGTGSIVVAIAMLALVATMMLPLCRHSVSVWWVAGPAWAWWTMNGWNGVLISASVGLVCVWVGVRSTRFKPPGC